MKALRPVVWSEGMHLAHHHFQLRDRYFEDSSTFALSKLVFKPYGLTRLELDTSALSNGSAALVHAAGVMPDGLVFSFPEEAGPDPLDVRDLFSPTAQRHVLSLTIPAYRPDRANCAEDSLAEPDTRYVPEMVAFRDETTGLDEKNVAVGRKNFRLTLDVEDIGDSVSLPIGAIIRDHSGNFVYDPHFVPPCLHIGASTRLMEMLHRLIDEMEAKSGSLAAERNAAGGQADFAPDEIVSYWLSHALQSSIAPLRHHMSTRTAHPEELYTELLRVSGALCTFSMETTTEQLPTYDHDDLEPAFDALERHIRSHLRVVLPKGATRIELERTEESFLRGEVPDPRCFENARWFLEAQISGSHAEAIADVPRLVKICSAKHIVRLVQSAHPGMQLEHAASAPAEIAPRLGAEYFRIDTDGPCWQSLLNALGREQTPEVGVYAPEALGTVELAILIAQS